MRLINIYCSDEESFKYSILLYLNCYNIKKNHSRIATINKNIKPSILKINKNIKPFSS